MSHRILIGLSVLALAACQQAQPTDPAAPVEAAPVAESASPATPAAPTADPVADFVARAEGCMHFAGEPAYDAQRQADINKALDELKCDRLSADAVVLKAAVSGDAAAVKRIEAAIDGWG